MSKKNAFVFLCIVIIALLTFIPFGSYGIGLGITSIILAFAFIGENYTENKLKTIFGNMAIILILSIIGTLVANNNIYICTLVTCIVGFFIFYLFSYENRISISLFSMGYYMFIIWNPIPISQLPVRLLINAYGVFVTFGLYFLVFKVK
ncbi:hypothetical protein [Clostridium ganghwense]|uniref:DUF1097 domain-containing protein n=1 Tax=Clostridium ganghwense TaxID=312089 RepID=A0ABT4CQ25_9CLOT|nr:hypothetical protein [Clostridium ganghwense]MCY6371058.1 hypothetical protein [Clostridium ganghwense]